jgi:hypothetical protein
MPQTQVNLVFALDLQSICDEYGFETEIAKGDKIIVLELDMHLIGPQYGFRT